MLLGSLFLFGLGMGCGENEECDCGPSAVQNAELNVGDAAPDFRLPDHRGGFVTLSDYYGKSNVVIAFFPAAFTPV
jgi:peroxiredoxin Q/BCP